VCSVIHQTNKEKSFLMLKS